MKHQYILTSAIPFYKILELKLIVELLPYYARFQCLDRNSTFSLPQVEQIPSGEGIKSKGIEIEEIPNNKSWLWREASVKDPDNNQLVLY